MSPPAAPPFMVPVNTHMLEPLSFVTAAVANMLHKPLPNFNRGILISRIQNLMPDNIYAALEAETVEKFGVEHVDVKRFKRDATEKLVKGEWKPTMKGLTNGAQSNEEKGLADF